MSSKKIVVVFGATGAQGGAVLRALQQSGEYQLRAVTRNANSDKSKQLAQLSNVSVVEADLNNETSVDAALKGADGVFLVTDFSTHLDQTEIPQGKRAIDSAIRNGVKQFVFSGLENAKNVIGKDVFHFDYKEVIEQYGFSQGDKLDFTSIRLSFFFENFPAMLFIHKISDGLFAVVLPMGVNRKMHANSVDDIGGVALSVFQNPQEYKSQVLPISADFLTGEEYVAALNKHFAPTKFVYNDMPLAEYEKLPFPGAVDLANMFEYYQTEKMPRDIELSKKLNKDLLDFDAYLVKNRDAILQKLQ